MTTLLYKRMFRFKGNNYLYKMEKTAPDEIQKTFGKVAEEDINNRLDFLPKDGITHRIQYDQHTNRPTGFGRMKKTLNDYGTYDSVVTENVNNSIGKFPYWVTLKGKEFETAYIHGDNINVANDAGVQHSVTPRIYEQKTIGYDKKYTKNGIDVLEVSYFPNSLYPGKTYTKALDDELNRETILTRANRLINRLKNMQNH